MSKSRVLEKSGSAEVVGKLQRRSIPALDVYNDVAALAGDDEKSRAGEVRPAYFAGGVSVVHDGCLAASLRATNALHAATGSLAA